MFVCYHYVGYKNQKYNPNYDTSKVHVFEATQPLLLGSIAEFPERFRRLAEV